MAVWFSLPYFRNYLSAYRMLRKKCGISPSPPKLEGTKGIYGIRGRGGSNPPTRLRKWGNDGIE